MKIKRLLLACVVGVFSCNIWAESTNPHFLHAVGEHFVLNQQNFVMKGFNYMPRYYALSDMTTWDWNEVDQELARGASLGANTVRIAIDYGYSTGNPQYTPARDVKVYYHPTPQYLAAMNHFLTLAQKHHMKTIFILFGYLPGFTFIGQEDYGTPSRYLQELLTPFLNDDRIAAWEIMSEGDLMSKKFGTRSDKVENFSRLMCQAARKTDTHHLITVGFADISNAASLQKYIDFISFHYYPDAALLAPKIANLRAQLLRPMPIVEAEFGMPSSGTNNASMSRHMLTLAANLDLALNTEHLAGALFWQLTDLAMPKTVNTRMTGRQYQRKFGVFDINLQPKPSAPLVTAYFTHRYNTHNRLTIKYSDVTLTPLGYRQLAIRLTKLQWLDQNHVPLQEIDFGTLAANAIEGQGWYANETGGQWLGNSNHISNLYLIPPANAAYLMLNGASAFGRDNHLQIYFANHYLGSIQMNPTAQDYFLRLH